MEMMFKGEEKYHYLTIPQPFHMTMKMMFRGEEKWKKMMKEQKDRDAIHLSRRRVKTSLYKLIIRTWGGVRP